MKLEIDLSDLFCDGDEPCDLQEAVSREVINNLTRTIREGVQRKVDEETYRVINAELTAAVREQMPTIINDLMGAQFTPVDQWGTRKDPTTFREALVSSIVGQLNYKKSRYESEKNAFSKAVDQTVAEHMKAFQVEFNKKVDADFTVAAFEYARTKLAAKLGIKL